MASWVQDDSDGGVGTNLAIALTSDVVAGNVIIATLAWADSAVTVTVDDDDGNGPYTALTQHDHASGGSVRIWWAVAQNSVTLTTTFTLSGSTGRTGFVTEIADAATPPSAEEGATGSGTALDSGVGQTAPADSVIVAMAGSPTGSGGFTPGSGYTLGTPTQTFGQSEWDEIPSSTTQDATMSQVNDVRWVIAMAVFDDAAAGGNPKGPLGMPVGRPLQGPIPCWI